MRSEKEIVLAYQEAHNAHDVEKALSFFTADIRYGMTGVWVKQGIDEVRALESWDAALNSHMDYHVLKVRQSRMNCSATETNDWLKLAGIGKIEYTSIKFEFKGEKIQHVRAQLAGKSEWAIDQAVNDVLRWALEAHPGEVQSLIPRGNFLHGEGHAERWLKLVQEWKEAKDQAG